MNQKRALGACLGKTSITLLQEFIVVEFDAENDYLDVRNVADQQLVSRLENFRSEDDRHKVVCHVLRRYLARNDYKI